MQDLGTVAGAGSSYAFGLNNAGQVVGYVDNANLIGFLKNPAGYAEPGHLGEAAAGLRYKTPDRW